MEGIANQRAGFLFARRFGLRAEAESYFDRAKQLYRDDWGATAVYECLEERSGRCLSHLHHPTTAIYSHRVDTIVGDTIDITGGAD